MILYAPKSDQIVEINIPENVNRIACFVSGGTDTALLLYVLGKYIIDNKRDITILPFHICYMDRPGFKDAINVTNKVRELLGCGTDIIENIHFEIFTHKETQFIPEWIVANFLHNGDVDKFYGAWTPSPKDENFGYQAHFRGAEGPFRRPMFRDDFCTPEQHQLAEETNTQLPHPEYPENFPVYYLECPFAKVDKKFIAEMYDFFKIKDEIFPLTWSCVGMFKETEGFTKPCGYCYWCKEKKWAFGEMDVPRHSYLTDFKHMFPIYWDKFVEVILKGFN